MCGILFHLQCHHVALSEEQKELHHTLIPLVKRRGPDDSSSHSVTFTLENGLNFTLSFFGAVLHLRGELTRQPQVNNDGDVLLWNGEIFGGIKVCCEENDTHVLFEKLSQLNESAEDVNTDVIDIFSSIQGPWACVYFNASTKTLWFGRDYLGRRSLMKTKNNKSFMITSVACKDVSDEDFSEIPAKFLYSINLDCLRNVSSDAIEESIKSHPLKPNLLTCTKRLDVVHRCQSTPLNTLERVTHSDGAEKSVSCGDNIPTSCGDNKDSSIQPYGGHLKCNELAGVENKCLNETVNKECPNGDKNHSRIKSHSGSEDLDANTRLKTINKLNLYSGNDGDKTLIHCKSSYGDKSMCDKESVVLNREDPLQKLLIEQEKVQSMFLNLLEESVRTRVDNVPRTNLQNESNVGILFSGGIDSVVLAALTDRCLPADESIDLINVAFEQKYKIPQNVKKKNIKNPTSTEKSKSFDVPDRLTGKCAIKELNPKRKWNFIEVDVTLEQLQTERKTRISNLVYPLTTVLDDSIGCAIWFAARGIGKLYKSNEGELELLKENYCSPVKVLLTGMGADEQLGGYARHRTKYESQGWKGLREEMEMELDRISSRNLGRDDRCISDHGREARFPFLDENVVSFLKSLPVCSKCDPRLPRGIGEKILLREIAAGHLGLKATSRYPKRAIQFGSRIAKLEGSKEKGSASCERLK